MINLTKPKSLGLVLLSILVALALGLFSLLLVTGFLDTHRQPIDATQKEKNNENQQSTTDPLSILPPNFRNSEGAENAAVSAPLAAGGGVATGFAMDLGAADSFLELTERFAEIVVTNGPENFKRLEPRAVLIETVNGLEARLLVGPFLDAKTADEACEVLILNEGLVCASALFEGELISRK